MIFTFLLLSVLVLTTITITVEWLQFHTPVLLIKQSTLLVSKAKKQLLILVKTLATNN
jgi:hypothetical protein